jgi:hypothetical protein
VLEYFFFIMPSSPSFSYERVAFSGFSALADRLPPRPPLELKPPRPPREDTLPREAEGRDWTSDMKKEGRWNSPRGEVESRRRRG